VAALVNAIQPGMLDRNVVSNCPSQLPSIEMLQRPLESTQYTSEQFQRLMTDHGVVCSMSRSGNVWDNAAMESFFSSLKTERTARKIYRSRDEAKADVFDYIERFYNPKRRHSTIGYMSPMEFERKAGLA
jgi:putative transposase